MKRIQYLSLGNLLRHGLDFLYFLFAHEADGDLHKVPHHRLDIPADITYLGKLCRLNLNEGGFTSLASLLAISVLPTPVGPSL